MVSFYRESRTECDALTLVEIESYPSCLPFNSIEFEYSQWFLSLPCQKVQRTRIGEDLPMSYYFFSRYIGNLFAFTKRLKNANPQCTYNPISTGTKLT